jgi:DNA-binding PadR family transcriptional regulator
MIKLKMTIHTPSSEAGKLAEMELPSRPRSPLWLVILSLVWEAPMHPYRMQALIKERGKDLIANVAQRNSIYQAIEALRRAGLIAIRETSRAEKRPERTIYEVTEEGRRTLLVWLKNVLSVPAREFPDFPAALSLAMMLEPEDVRMELEARIAALETRLVELEKPYPNVPRLFLIESEYMAAIVRAEVKWLRGLVADLRSRRLTWSEAWIRQVAETLGAPPEPEPPAKPRSRRGSKRSPSKAEGRAVSRRRT